MAIRLPKADFVFEGGGVKGIGLVGALSVFEQEGYVPVRVAGTSAGAIVAALVAAGYTAAEIKTILTDLDFRALLDPSWVGRILPIGPLIFEQGLYNGNALLVQVGINSCGSLGRNESEEPSQGIERARKYVL